MIEARPEAAPALVVAAPNAVIEALVEKKDVRDPDSGAEVSVRIVAFPDQSLVGRIARRDSLSGTKPLYKFIIDVVDPDVLLKGGMRAHIRTRNR